MLAVVRVHREAPHIWHRALGNALNRNNKDDAISFDNQKTVFTTDPHFGAQLYAQLWKRVAVVPPIHCVHR